MDEPAALILAWVAHHLALGATEAHVFLDRPNPEAEAALRDVPGCFVRLCDDGYWAASSRGEPPLRHTGRQKFDSTEVYRTRQLDWVLHCDADEFVDVTGDFLGELAGQEGRVLRLRNLERVRRGAPQDIFEGSFRGMLADAALVEEIYGRWAGFLETGMAGYCEGKDIARTDEPFTMGVHFPIDTATLKTHTDPFVELKTARLLHFDGLTPLHVALKLLKRAQEPTYKDPRKFGAHRTKQIRFASNHAGKPKQFAQMIEGVFGATADQAVALGGGHVEMAFDPRSAMAQFGLEADLSVVGFDAELRRREAGLIAEVGLEF